MTGAGAHNTIVTSRAGKDLISCLVSGLLTIGPRFGGAIDDAARFFQVWLCLFSCAPGHHPECMHCQTMEEVTVAGVYQRMVSPMVVAGGMRQGLGSR